MTRWPAPATAPERHRRLRRSGDGRVVAGVVAGLAEHLGVDVLVLRAVFAVLVAAGGAGVLLYAALWVAVADEAGPPADRPGGRRLPAVADPAQLAAFAALAGGVTLLASVLGLGVGGPSVWPVVAAVVGGTIIWRQADDGRRRRWLEGAGLRRPPGTGGGPPPGPAAAVAPAGAAPVPSGPLGWAGGAGDRASVLRLGLGALLVAAGVAGFLAANDALRQAQQGFLAIAAVVAGLALVTGPWWLRTARELAAERRERIRTQERAELAARVHDSVLHTLALIQRHAGDPREVTRLARGQERDLRSLLYRPPEAEGAAARLGSTVERVAGEVEDVYGVPIEVVVVGDCPLDERLLGLVQASREAMVNAAKSSGAATVSAYVEVEPDAVSVFVRDRGRGFDLASVGPDRYGIRESIVGRMARHGGTAEVRTAPGAGTEVRLSLARRAP